MTSETAVKWRKTFTVTISEDQRFVHHVHIEPSIEGFHNEQVQHLDWNLVTHPINPYEIPDKVSDPRCVPVIQLRFRTVKGV